MPVLTRCRGAVFFIALTTAVACSQEPAPQGDKSAGGTPRDASCGREQDCRGQRTDFILGESVAVSRPQVTSIGRMDTIGATGEKLSVGVDEVKTLYGADRVLDWSAVSFLEQQSSSLTPGRDDIILQAFNMSYSYIESQLPDLKRAGYSIIQISPPQETLDIYRIWWESYQPVDNRVFANKLGSEAELRSMVKAAHAQGLKVIADTVLNHMADPLRYGVGHPLAYGDLYRPEDFVNYDLYTDLLQYNFSQRDSKIDALVFFYSPQRALYRRFQAFLERRGHGIDGVLASPGARARYELLFVREQLPWLYADLERLSAEGNVRITFDQDAAICTQFGTETPCGSNAVFNKQWQALFGAGALIVRPYYFELTANQFPIYENEWDQLDKVAVKWYPGLPSLNKASAYVQKTHADFLEKMLRIGIDGFRLDAVKHIPKDYFARLILDLQKRLKGSDIEVDGESLATKPLYVYGEMATSKAEIANAYRQGMDVTDFFLLDTFMYASVFKENFHLYGRGEENLQKLRKSSLERSVKAGDGKGWQLMLSPKAVRPSDSWFSLESFDFDAYMKQMKTPISFARIHDSVVGDMFLIKNYQQAMLGHAYMLAAAEGRPLIYGSDENLALNAGADYKEKVVLAGIRFRQLAGSLPYTDRFENRDYCAGCERPDLLFIDRGDAALAILYSGRKSLYIDALNFPSLREGCYVELMSGRRFTVDGRGEVARGGTTALSLPARSAAYIVASSCDREEINAAFTLEDGEKHPEEDAMDVDFPVYLRGTLNGWRADSRYRFQTSRDPGCLDLKAAFPQGQTDFKIADSEWQQLDAGRGDDQALVIGKSWKLGTYSAANELRPAHLSIELTQPTRMALKLCGVGTGSPTLRLTPLQAGSTGAQQSL